MDWGHKTRFHYYGQYNTECIGLTNKISLPLWFLVLGIVNTWQRCTSSQDKFSCPVWSCFWIFRRTSIRMTGVTIVGFCVRVQRSWTWRTLDRCINLDATWTSLCEFNKKILKLYLWKQFLTQINWKIISAKKIFFWNFFIKSFKI